MPCVGRWGAHAGCRCLSCIRSGPSWRPTATSCAANTRRSVTTGYVLRNSLCQTQLLVVCVCSQLTIVILFCCLSVSFVETTQPISDCFLRRPLSSPVAALAQRMRSAACAHTPHPTHKEASWGICCRGLSRPSLCTNTNGPIHDFQNAITVIKEHEYM